MESGLRIIEHTLKIRVDDTVPVVLRHPKEQSVFRNSGIIYQNVQSLKIFDDLVDHLLRLRKARYVGLKRRRLAARLLDSVYNFLRLRRAGPVGDHHVRAVLSKPQSDRPTDAARPTGHQCDLVIEPAHGVRPERSEEHTSELQS